MFTDTQSELRMTQHTARIERVNREGWMWQTSAPTNRRRPRRHIGDALVRFGERLRAVPADRATDPATV